MQSWEGETVDFTYGLRARGPVEEWLTVVEVDMVKTLRNLLSTCFSDFDEDPKTRAEWTRVHCSQLVHLVSNIVWCNSTEEALNNLNQNSEALEDCINHLIDQLDELVVLIRSNLSFIERSRLVALVTQEVHSRDILT